jgi:dTDP-4-amino-4,6-dideoxygalactose transaminase
MYKTKSKQIFLSPPYMGNEELPLIEEAFKSNYIAPLGPMVDAFEQEFADYVGIKHCVAVSSGTAAMHLALRNLGVGPGDEVFASTLTFVGSVTPVVFQGARPVFFDCERRSWNMDPVLLEEELKRSSEKGSLPAAVIPTDLYGQCCDLLEIVKICDFFRVPVVCDSAEAMGAKFKKSFERRVQSDEKKYVSAECEVFDDAFVHAGVGARASVYSFNGNKIITTSGGGMLSSDDEEFIMRARKLSQQAREDYPHYEHNEIGYNYRMSNILAAIGRGQLRIIEDLVIKRREIFDYYKSGLEDLSGLEFMPEPKWSRSNRWLTVVLITPALFGSDREQVRLTLEKNNIESRPVWKPMHLQPVFVNTECSMPGAEKMGNSTEKRINEPILRQEAKALSEKAYPCRVIGGEVAEELFLRGLCLPSGTAMTNSDLDTIIELIRKCHRP